MPQSLAKVYTHIVFSTKHRQSFITDAVRAKLHSYMIGVISAMGSYTCELYANPDHVHILNTLSRTITIADMVSKIKTSSSKRAMRDSLTYRRMTDGEFHVAIKNKL